MVETGDNVEYELIDVNNDLYFEMKTSHITITSNDMILLMNNMERIK